MSTQKPNAWTVLAYTIADDKGGFHAIDQAAENDVKDMCEAADLGRFTVALQLDLKRHPGVYRATIRPRRAQTTRQRRQRQAIRESRNFRTIDPRRRPLWRNIVHTLQHTDLQLLEDRTHLDAASGAVLRRFLASGRRQCPARRFILHFLGHSFGPMGLFYDAKTGTPNPHVLRLTDLARALRSKDGPVDVVLFRDCFMDNLEAAFELHRAARFIIASQAQSPIAGAWPWLNMMSVLMPSIDSSDVGRSLVLQLEGFYSQESGLGGLDEVPCALIDVDGAQQVARPLKRLVKALSAARGDAARRRACGAALENARLGQNLSVSRPGDPALIDVLVMCRNLQQLDRDPVARAATALSDVIHAEVITSFHVSRGPFRGLALYYKPVSQTQLDESFVQASDARDKLSDERYYRTLALSRATGWDQIALQPLAP